MYGCNFRTWFGSWLSWKWCSQKAAVVIDIVVLVLEVVNIAEVNGVRECTDLPVRSEAVNIVIRYKIVTREIKYSYLHLFDDGRWRLYDIEIVTRRSDGEVASLENLLLDLVIDIFPSDSHNENRISGNLTFYCAIAVLTLFLFDTAFDVSDVIVLLTRFSNFSKTEVVSNNCFTSNKTPCDELAKTLVAGTMMFHYHR